jgi:hypothetical protein
MASWHDLPNEIRDEILRLFCLDLCYDFRRVISTLLPYLRRPESRNDQFIWPSNGPSYLTSFASAIQTCHYFRNAIQNEIKVDGKSPGEALQDLQFDSIRKSLDFSRIRALAWGNVELEHVYAFAGCFWRNAKLAKSSYQRLLGKFLLHSLSPESRLSVIPHLEGWVLENATSSCVSNKNVTLELERDDHFENDGGIVLVRGNLAVLEVDFVILSIDRVVIEQTIEGAEPVVDDIRNSTPGSWWLFHSSVGSYNYHNPVAFTKWVLVNYEQRKLYKGTSCWCWESVWDLSKLN